MRNIFLLFFAFSIGFFNSNAQEANLDSVSNHSFGGIATAHHGSRAFTYYISGVGDEKKKMATLHIKAFSDQLQPSEEIRTEISKGSMVLTCLFMEGDYLFLVGDPVAKTRTLLQITRDGKIAFSKKEEAIPPTAFTKTAQYKLIKSMPEGAVMVMPSGKNGGYTLVNYNRQLEEQWRKEFVPKSGSMEVIQFSNAMERLAVLEKAQPDTRKERYVYSIRTIMIDRGLEIGSRELKDEETNDYFFPSSYSSKHGMDMIGGLYYKDGQYDEKNPGGMFMGQLSPDGHMVRKTKVPFSELKKFIPDNILSSMQNGSQIIVQDVFRTVGSELTVSCEMLSRSYDATTKEAKVKLSDPFVLYTGGEGEISAINIIPGTQPTNLSIKGRLATANTHTLAAWLKQQDLFAYRFNVHMRGAPQLCYSYMDTSGKKAFLIPSDSPTIAKSSALPLNRMPSSVKIKANEALQINTDENDGILPIWEYQKVFITEAERVFIYSLANQRLMITALRMR